MTVIYIDTLFLLNAMVDYLLLLGAARLAGEPLRRRKFLVGALLGGGYAVAIFLPGFGFMTHPLVRLSAAAFMVLLAYGGSRRLLRQAVCFFALSCAFGGGVMAIGLLGRQGLTLSGGVIYSGMDLKIVLLSAAGCYGILTIVFERAGKHNTFTSDMVPVRVVLGERSAELTALVDTGNTLSDPVTGWPVMVAEGECLSPLFPADKRPTPAQLHNPAQALLDLGTGELTGRLRLLPYRAVGVEQGILLTMKADEVWISGAKREVLVALSPTPVSDGGGYRALVGIM